MKQYIRRRLLQFIPIVIGICILNFILIQLAPGDLAEVVAGESGQGDDGANSKEFVDQLRVSFGLNVPLYMQFLTYFRKLLTLDLGFSHRYGAPVIDLIGSRIGATVLLGLTSLSLAVTLGVLLGVLCARNPGGRFDRTVSSITAFCYSIPVFWLALMLVVVFGVKLQLFPISGLHEIGVEAGGRWALYRDVLWHLFLPASTLAVYGVAVYTRYTRASMADVLQEDYIRTARSKGLSSRQVYFRHALRNAFLPVLTLVGVGFGELLGGSIVIETVFSWPGLGKLTFDAITNRDTNLLLSILFLSSLLVMFASLAVDVLYAKLDPRIELKR
jgi:peptide/nickel transport system permease protein